MKKILALTASCAAITFATGAHAQSIDYGTMEELFGEPVTTSATGKPQRSSEVPLTMEILTQDDIRRSGAVNLAEVLRQVNGVNVVENSSQSYDVSVRGYNQPLSQRLLVLVNGRQVYLDHYGMTAWSTIPVQLEEIRQIEVVKGPNTALFGFNAVSGVINIITYNPLYDNKSSAGVTVGTQDYRQGHYVQSLKVSDKFGIRLSAGKRESSGFDTSANSAPTVSAVTGASLIADPEQESLNIDAMYQLTENSQLRVELSGSNSLQSDLLIGTGSSAKYETRSGKVSYMQDSDIGLIKASLYKNTLSANLANPSTVGKSESNNEVIVAQLENTIQLNNNHTLRLNTEFRTNELTGDVLATGAKASYDVFSGGAMWNWKINDQWSLTNALRLDHLELDHNGVFSAGIPYTQAGYQQDTTEESYNSGLLWQASDKDSVRLTTSRGLEVPSLIELALDTANGPVTVAGNPNLDTAIVTNYELAWDRKVDFVDGGLLRTAIFHQKTQDIKSLLANVSTTLPPVVSTANIGESSSYGIEAALSGKFSEKLAWGISYIYQHINDKINNQAAPGIYTVPKEYEEGNPQQQAKVKLSYTDGAWEADALAYYVSSTKSLYSTPVGTTALQDADAYIGLNARIGYTFDNDLTVALSGANLQQNDTTVNSMPDVERRAYLSVTKKF